MKRAIETGRMFGRGRCTQDEWVGGEGEYYSQNNYCFPPFMFPFFPGEFFSNFTVPPPPPPPLD